MNILKAMWVGLGVVIRVIVTFFIILALAILFYIARWHPQDPPHSEWNHNDPCLTEGDGLCY